MAVHKYDALLISTYFVATFDYYLLSTAGSMSDSRPSSRPIQSCFQCRKRKIKCSKSYPCAPCQLRGEGDSCREVGRRLETSKRGDEAIEEMSERLQLLEETVLKLTKQLPPEVPPVPVTDRDNSESAQLVHQHAFEMDSATRSSFCSDANDEDAAMMLEDFAMGHRTNRTRAAQGVCVDDYGRLVASGSPLGALGLPAGHALGLIVDPSTNIIQRLLQILPSQLQSRALIQFYFEKLEWFSKVLHAPTFLAEVDNLQALIACENVNLIRTPFLGIYCMVLCLAIHLVEPAVCSRTGLDFIATPTIANQLYCAAQVCLHYNDFLGSHCLESLQCIILMGVYQQNCGESDSHWALLGTAIKVAQNLGMSRLGSEIDDRDYPVSWRSPVKREVARRVWWSLVFDDWSHAAAHHGTYSIHPSQNHTGYPLNINDADLAEGIPAKAKPLNQYTEMTSFLCRLRFVELYRVIVDNMQSCVGYGFVAEVDAKISRCIADLPSLFGLSSTVPSGSLGRVKGMEITLCYIMGETRRMRLHRPFLFRGYKDRKYMKSREQCVNSAKAILYYLRSDDDQARVLLKWWIVLFYGFAATVVLFIDLCYHSTDTTEDLEQRRVELRRAVDLFKTAEHMSPVSQNAIALLDNLLSAEAQLSIPSRKRKATDDDGPFEHIVKRIVIDASRGYSSPSSQLYDQSSQSSSSNASPISSVQTSFPNDYPQNDILAHGASFCDDMIFSGMHFDETTMAELSQFLASNPSYAYTAFNTSILEV